MNKTELIAALAEKTGSNKKDAEKAINAFVDVVTESLANGDKIQIVGFGSFEVKARPARTARNPRTGEEIKIEASKAPVFKAGKALKTASTSKANGKVRPRDKLPAGVFYRSNRSHAVSFIFISSLDTACFPGHAHFLVSSGSKRKGAQHKSMVNP